MVQDINKNQEIIQQSLSWADKYNKESFPRKVFKDYRRQLKRIGDALSENCSAAAYGESQVGKSYLMSSLLSTPEMPFEIQNGGVSYSFIDKINPSGGNNTQKESTGIITRFTIRPNRPGMENYVKIRNLSVVDLILLMTDSYYNDVNITSDALLKDQIDHKLSQMTSIWSDSAPAHSVISEDDIDDIMDYLNDIIGHSSLNLRKSSFRDVIGPVIDRIPSEKWVDVFGLLWNNNPEINRLFNILITEYKKLNYATEVYVPFDAVLRDKGTLLKIDWLDSVCGIHNEASQDELYTDIYDATGNLLASNFSKAFLSALIGELTFVLPERLSKERRFLRKIDLLDFPGARSREKIAEEKLGEMLPTILRRGKVAYLFNKYSRSLKISSVLFCHHNHMKAEPSLGLSINNWIEGNIGKTPALRAEHLSKTNGIAPLFFVCTKFNIDLEKTKNDSKETVSKLSEHWSRFDSTIPEIIKPNEWLEDWVPQGGAFSSRYFRNVYLLRDFYWSAKNHVFDGFSETLKTVEQSVHVHSEYPDYFDDLKSSFLENAFVKKHFEHPEQAWNDVATINNDGSKAIIRNLDAIADVLDDARHDRYHKQLEKIRDEIISRLSVYYDPDDKEQNNIKLRKITGDIKLRTEFAFGEKPELFGQIIDSLMVSSSEIRSLVYDIMFRHTEKPKAVSAIKMIRAKCRINTSDDRSVNIEKMCKRYNDDETGLRATLSEMGVELDDVISDDSELLATLPDVITKHIVDLWNNHINAQVGSISEVLPHADEIAFMMMTLLSKLGIKKKLSSKITEYYNKFDNSGLPNAIADFASLTLNNFVSTVGREYMTSDDVEGISKKAKACELDIDLSSPATSPSVESQPLLDVLSALDQMGHTINDKLIDFTTLQRLPFWDSYHRWENFITIGLIYSSDISHEDPVANGAMKLLLESSHSLYR